MDHTCLFNCFIYIRHAKIKPKLVHSKGHSCRENGIINIIEVLNLISNGSLKDCHTLLSKNVLMNDRSLKSPYEVEQNHELFEQ